MSYLILRFSYIIFLLYSKSNYIFLNNYIIY
ncbi:hypothetical protein PI27_gp002 [Listeria phage WIL-1]|nr:hypothetical protein PI27_gp002 [Listeria phage WIL-1]